jgi:hypothetical protein
MIEDSKVALLATVDTRSDAFKAALLTATALQLEAALHRVPTTDQWRFLKLGRRLQLLRSAKSMADMIGDEPQEQEPTDDRD